MVGQTCILKMRRAEFEKLEKSQAKNSQTGVKLGCESAHWEVRPWLSSPLSGGH